MELHNHIVEFLKSLPNIQNKGDRHALIFSAALDKELEDQIEFEGATEKFCQLLVKTLASYGTLHDGRHALVAILEAAKNNVGQEGKEQCDALIHQVQTAEPRIVEMPSRQIDNPTEPKIDVHLKKIQEVDEVTGVEADTTPEGSTKVTIEDVKKGKRVTGMTIKKV